MPKVEASGQGEKVTAEGVNAAGTPTKTQYTANFDGKDYPLIGSPNADTVSLKRIDARTTERTDKKGGKVVLTFTRVVSQDGKTMTVTVKGTNAQGQTVNNVAVWESNRTGAACNRLTTVFGRRRKRRPSLLGGRRHVRVTMLGTRWDHQTWPTIKAELKKALEMRSRIQRAGTQLGEQP